MFSRAHLLVERDFELMEEEKPWGIEATPLRDDSIFEWTAKILGLRGTLWEGGVFRLYIKFDENYNSRPPEVCFHTIPFHPNVDMITGRPSIDFLDDRSQWNESYTFSTVLQAVQRMLSEPSMNNAVNSEAVNMIEFSPHSYKQMVQDCVAASQRVEVGLSPHQEDKVRFGPQKEEAPRREHTRTAPKRAAKISFEDYHLTWSGIATSKPDPEDKNEYIESLRENPNLQTTHFGLPLEEFEAQMKEQMDYQKSLIYGKFKSKTKTEEDSKQAQIDKVNQMRKIYLQPRTPRKTPTLDHENSTLQREEEPWEREVDDLVAWTNGLNEEEL